jgi:nucleoid-associated protein YgaU
MSSLTPYERHGQPSPDPDARVQEYTFKVTDTISGLAHRFYGDWRLWRLIADRNGIKDVRYIPVGTVLLIPERPMQQGRYESL